MTENQQRLTPGRVLITGAAGGVGTMLRGGLPALGWTVRGFDLVMPADSDGGSDSDINDSHHAPDPTEWVLGDITDPKAIQAAMADVDVVVHLAGIPIEDRFEALLHTNFEGTQYVFDAAVRAGVPRVLFASSNHAVGYHQRADFADRPIGPRDRARPDTLYGVSKVFGEALASYYHDRYALQVACVRIGACRPEPDTRRMLDTWLSPADAVRLFHALATAPGLGYEIVYGASANPTAWCDHEPGRRLGYEPRDSPEVFRHRFVDDPVDPDDPEVRFLGGDFTTAVPPAA
ncbi:MAG: NAD(P)-dependent oxidoreductase [Catenulispora sp.]|nr:NAD(P)-dependent oxidoreductase [Catenulispora sp.]